MAIPMGEAPRAMRMLCSNVIPDLTRRRLGVDYAGICRLRRALLGILRWAFFESTFLNSGIFGRSKLMLNVFVALAVVMGLVDWN
jgi:hypothetical protein